MKIRRISWVALVLMDVACSSGETGAAGTSTTSEPTQTQTTVSTDSQTTGGVTTTQPSTTSTAGQTSSSNPVTPPAGSGTNTVGGDTGATGNTGNSGDTGGTSDVDTSEPTAPVSSTGGSDTETGPTGNTSTGNDTDVVDVGADDKFSFFVTSYQHIALLAGNDDGFGGDLRYNDAATGLDGADAICQEIARRVSFGHRTWKAYLSTSSVNAIDRIGAGPWYDFLGVKVADSPQDLITGANRQPGGCCENGTYDELGTYHDGSTDQNNDGIDDDDHDTMTATNKDGTYAGFSCEDWTSTTATSGGGGGGGRPGGGGGIMMGHSWPARSGEHWATSHAGHQCAAGTNFIQDGAGDSSTVGGGGGYGGFYCFALAE